MGSTASAVMAAAAAGRTPVDINSVVAGMVDRGAWRYWDTLTTAAGTTLQPSYILFQNPIGSQDPITSLTKNKLDTNMTKSGQFPPPRCLVLEAICIDFDFMLLADIIKFCQSYYLEFRIDDKIFFEGKLKYFPSGDGVFGASTLSGDYSWANGFMAPQATVRWGRYSKYIAPLQAFTFSLICPVTPPTLTTAVNGGVGLKLVPYLDGLTDRSVQ
jgi:hypothetical protein